MRKVLICVLIIIMASLCGCSNSSEDYLSYKDTESSSEVTADNRITEGEFFADNLAIVTGSDNSGGDNTLTAGAELLVDRIDNKVIYSDHAYDKLYPASLTKLLTALVVFNYGELTDTVTFSHNAANITEIGAKLCGFQEGDQIPMETLLKSMLIYSGNDAAVAIAEHVGGSVDGFAKMMNDEALKIGAVDSHFVNPNGLHDDNEYTTAYDLYLIFNELLQYDTFRSIINTATYKAEYKDKDGAPLEKTFETTNEYLLKEATLDPGLDAVGGKTGTTAKAGCCLVLLSKDNTGKEFISIVLKATTKDDLYSQMTHMLSKAEAP